MPTELDVIETRLRTTLTAVAEQTDLEDAALLPVAALVPAGDHRRRPHRVWLAAGVAAALLLLVGVVAAVRDRDAADVTSEATSTTAVPAGVLPLVVATYLPAGLSGWTQAADGSITPGNTVVLRGAVNFVGAPAGQGLTITWTDVGRGSMTLRMAAGPGPVPTDDTALSGPGRFAGQDGLRFRDDIAKRDAQLASLRDQEDDLRKQYSDVFEKYQTAPPDQQEILKAQKDSLIVQAKDLDIQIATLMSQSLPIYGGRSDVTLELTGSVSPDELQRVAVGLHVVPGRAAPVDTPAAPSLTAAPTTSTTELVAPPTSPTPDTAPSPTPTTTAASAIPEVGTGPPTFVGPIPVGWQTTAGAQDVAELQLIGSFALHDSGWVKRVFPDGLLGLNIFGWSYRRAGAPTDTDVVVGLEVHRQLDPGALLDDKGSHPTVETNPNGLQLADLGGVCGSGRPGEAPLCGHLVVVWSADTVDILVIDPSVDALAFARSRRPA